MRYAAVALIALLAGCREEVAVQPPAPVLLTEDAVAHYCMMSLAEHPGPKAQIHLAGAPDPIFFSQVRDGVAYLKQPERTAEITAVYVSNMSRAPSWDAPGPGNWILAADAFFVVGADVDGGMGVPEIVPYETEADAQAFAARKGGTVMRLGDIPPSAVLGGVEITGDEGS